MSRDQHSERDVPAASASEQPWGVSAPALVFGLGEERFALPGERVREVLRWREPTPVPGAPPLLAGILVQRGVILTVVDVRRLLGFATPPPGRSARFIVQHDDELRLALLVDQVYDLVDIAAVPQEPLPATLDPQQARILQAIIYLETQPVALIDPAALVQALYAGV